MGPKVRTEHVPTAEDSRMRSWYRIGRARTVPLKLY